MTAATDQSTSDSAVATASTAASKWKLPEEVVTHPLVLLSIVDHYNRVAKDTSKRVVGVLLGSTFQGKCDITNSFAVPFDEDLRNPGIWYLDHDYLESMFAMFKKINAKERIVGFYSTGPKIRKADLDIDELFRRYCPNPVFVICDVRANVEGLPTTAYGSIEEVEEDGKAIKRTFKHVKSSVGAYEAEEVGVEHLLRDINDPSVSSLAGHVKHKMTALAGLKERLEEMKVYLENVLAGKLPPNHQIIYNMQTIFNLLPNLNVDSLVRSMFVKTNDMHFVIYLSSLIRCTIALHNLVNNKIKYRELEDFSTTAEKKEKEAEKNEKEAEKKEKKTTKHTRKTKEMPWVANNNQAGDVRAPALSAALREKKRKEQEQAASRREWKLELRALAIDELAVSIDREATRGCALVHPADFPSTSTATSDAATSSSSSVEFVHPRVHAQFVVALRAHSDVPRGCIALTQPHFINLELCVGQVESWSLFQEQVPSINAMAIEIRPLMHNASAAALRVDAQEFARAFAKHNWQRILTENERTTMVYKDQVEYFVRVLEIDAEDDSETDFTMPDSFRGRVDEDTQVFVSVDGVEQDDQDDDSGFQLVNQTPRPKDQSLAAMRDDVVVVNTSDEEEFPVKKKLLFPCIKLSSAVLAGRGVHKDASSSIDVEIDCLTFDRVLLYLEHEARNDGTEYQFDPQYAEELLSAAKALGCIGLQEVCEKRLGEFETRVRKEPIRWDEVVRRNNAGEIWLVMQGMVFDVTRWLPEHPGGSVIIPEQAVNVDCTVMFEIYHSSRQSFRYLKQFYIGEIYEADLALVPKSTETPSPGFVEEFNEYTTWRIIPEVPSFKSF